MSEELDVSVVMPCLDEAETLAASIARAREGIVRAGLTGEVVVADNGSTDGSLDIARAAGVRLVHVRERGYGNAYRAGFAAARGRLVVMGDSDDTYDFSKLDALIAPLGRGADMVLGSRLRGDINPGAMPWLHRYIGNPALSAMLNLFYRTRISDTHSGFRAFDRKALLGLGLRTSGMEFASEMLIVAARAGWTLAEVPITYHARAGDSKLRTFRDGWRHLRLLLLYSPTHLFLLPGTIAVLGGLLLQFVLLRGPIEVLGRYVDFHFMFVGGLVANLGVQVLMLGLFATSWQRLPSWFTLERGLVAGGLLFAVGMITNVAILIQWLTAGFTGPVAVVRYAILALTLTVLGLQILFSSFYLDLVRAMRHSSMPTFDVEEARDRRVSQHIDAEREHEDAWYRRVASDGFFDREGFRQLQQANLRALRRKVPLQPHYRVLSVGCGSGEYEVLLAREVAEVVGLDLSAVAVDAATHRAHAAGVGNARFLVGAIGATDLDAGPFDVALAFGVLHHLGDAGRMEALQWIRRLLRPGGWLYVRDPNARGLLRQLAGARARRDEFHSPNEAAIDPAALLDDVRAAGFTGAEIDYTDVVLGPLPWVVAGGPAFVWRAVALVDRAWLAVPGLRTRASQFAVVARS